jgi:hypothetical protein
VIGADHPSYGRSLASRAREAITLTLLECGSITVTLTRDTQPLYGQINAGWPALVATTNEDGAFTMPRLPAGPVTLRVQVFADQSEGVYETVVVEAGKQTAVAIEVPAGTDGRHDARARRREPLSVPRHDGIRKLSGADAQFVAGIHGRADWTGEVVPTFERLVPSEYTA